MKPIDRESAHAGLLDGRWQVRRASAAWLLDHAQPDDLERLVPLLRDPFAKVRHAAVLTVALAHGSTRGAEVVPLLLERALADESLRVRRMAVSMLAWQLAHPDLEGFFTALIETEHDAKLLRYARAGVRLARERKAC